MKLKGKGRSADKRLIALVAKSLIGAMLCINSAEAISARPSRANERSPEDWFAQVSESTLQEITSVQIFETDAGFEIVLVTEGSLPAPSVSTVENAVVLEIPGVVLALPEGDRFEEFGPVEGVALVQVANATGGIEVAITGAEAPPVVEPGAGSQGLTVSVSPGVAGVDNSSETPPEEALQLTVTATRREETLDNIARSVTVITREELEAQTGLSRRNVRDILSQLIPGASPPSGRTPATFNLRGQGVSILIDGIPQDTNSNNTFSAPLAGLDPSTIERIEVVRGPNAIFGGQAIGGVINIITRRPTEQLVHTTEIGVNSSLTNAADALGFTASQQISGRSGNLDFTGGITLDSLGQSYDAAGDRVGEGQNLDNTSSLNALLNLGLDLNERERIQFRGNFTQSERETEFIQDISTDDIPGIQKARLIRRPEGTQVIGFRDGTLYRNTNLSLSYSNEDLFGSEFLGQLYYRSYSIDGDPPFDNRIFGGEGITITSGNTDQFGTRLQVDTPFNSEETISLLWGLDYANERISQTRNMFDTEEFDSSGGLILRKIGEETSIPPYTFNDLGLFAQLQWEPTDWLTINGGTRYANLQASVDDYQIRNPFNPAPPRNITGGNINADGFVFNIGTVVDVTDNVSAFASFGQGFSFPDLGRTFRRPPADLDNLENAFDITEPVKVDNYELGIRGNWDTVQASLAGFYSYSDSGFDIVFDDFAELRNVRSPRRTYGIEGTLDWQPAANWNVGSTVSWQEGEFDEDEDGDFIAFDSYTIAPLKITGYIENQTTPGWRNRLQFLYSGNRRRGFEAGSDSVEIEGYIVVDLLSSIDVGDNGEVTIGVRNLFNSLYFPVYAQASSGFYDPGNYAGSGTSLSVSYKFTW